MSVDRRDRLAESEGDREITEVIAQRLDDLLVAEVEHVGPALDDGHLGAERGEDRRVLDADDARSHHDQRGGDAFQGEHTVRVDDGAPVEVHAGRPSRAGTHGDDRRVETHAPLAGRARDCHRVRVVEPCRAGEKRDVVARQLVADDIHLPGNDLARLGPEVLDGDVLLDPVAGPVMLAMAHTGEVQH